MIIFHQLTELLQQIHRYDAAPQELGYLELFCLRHQRSAAAETKTENGSPTGRQETTPDHTDTRGTNELVCRGGRYSPCYRFLESTEAHAPRTVSESSEFSVSERNYICFKKLDNETNTKHP